MNPRDLRKVQELYIIPPEYRSYLEEFELLGQRLIRCRQCKALFVTVKDAIAHIKHCRGKRA